MNNKKIIINSCLNSKKYEKSNEERLTKDWIDYRLKIFMTYTLNSLKAQNSQDFTALIRYDDLSENIVKDILREYNELPQNIVFVKESTIKNKVKELIKGYEQLYLLRMDTDDLIHKDFIKSLHEYSPKKETVLLLTQEGFIYNSITDELAHCFYSIPSFYTIVFNAEEFINDKSNVYFDGHAYLLDFPYEIMGKDNYVIVVHSLNSSTTFNYYETNQLIIDNKAEANYILSQFMQ